VVVVLLQVCNARRHARGAPASSRIESLCGEINQSINYYSDETRSEATTSAITEEFVKKIQEGGRTRVQETRGGEARSNIDKDKWAREGPAQKHATSIQITHWD